MTSHHTSPSPIHTEAKMGSFSFDCNPYTYLWSSLWPSVETARLALQIPHWNRTVSIGTGPLLLWFASTAALASLACPTLYALLPRHLHSALPYLLLGAPLPGALTRRSPPRPARTRSNCCSNCA